MKVGDKVCITRKLFDTGIPWIKQMDEFIGDMFVIVDELHGGFLLDGNPYVYPTASLELVATKENMELKESLLAFKNSVVENDNHYKKSVEPIELIEAFDLNFNLGNCIKYIARCNHKGNKQDDLRKALYYLNREFNGVD